MQIRFPFTARHPITSRSLGQIAKAFTLVVAFFAITSATTPANAIVVVSGPDDGSAFFPLDMPTGQFDERGLSGFEYLIAGEPSGFFSLDQYLIQGEDTNPTQAIGNDLGVASDLSGVPMNFSIQHNLVGGSKLYVHPREYDHVKSQRSLLGAKLCCRIKLGRNDQRARADRRFQRASDPGARAGCCGRNRFGSN